MAALIVTDSNFETEVIKADKPVLVDFWAPWCGPCTMAGTIIEELADEYKDRIKVGKINVDENPKTAEKLGIMSIPTVILFKDGKEAERLVGFAGKEGYTTLIAKVLNSNS